MHNVLVITYWAFDDALIQTYTLPYIPLIKQNLPSGSKIILVTQETSEERRLELLNDSERDNSVYELLPLSYTPFGGKALVSLSKIIKQLRKVVKENQIQTLHCWCTPAGAIGVLLKKVTGCDLIIDSFEPHAENMVENGTWEDGGFAFKTLFKLEKVQAKKSKHLIGLTKGMKDYTLEKYKVERNDLFVKPSAVNLETFNAANFNGKREELGFNESDTVCVYAGKLGGIYLDIEVFQFWKECSDIFKSFKVVFLTAHDRNEIDSYCNQLNLDPTIIQSYFVPHKEVPAYLSVGDFALNPVKPLPSKRYCTSIKDGEYWAIGLPVVITDNISDDSDIIRENNIGVVIKNPSELGMKKAATDIKQFLSESDPEEISEKARNIATFYRSLESQAFIYKEIYQEKSR